MKDVVMVIPGAEAQKPLIKKIQDMGYNVVCVNPDTEASGYESANIGRQGNILDKEFVKTQSGDFTQRIFAMENRSFYKAKNN